MWSLWLALSPPCRWMCSIEWKLGTLLNEKKRRVSLCEKRRLKKRSRGRRRSDVLQMEVTCGSAGIPDGRDLRNTMWRCKGPLEPPEPRLRLKQECCVDKPSLRGSDAAFSRAPASPCSRSNTVAYVSAAIRAIADYVHHCLPALGQTGVNPQGGWFHTCSPKWIYIYFSVWKVNLSPHWQIVTSWTSRCPFPFFSMRADFSACFSCNISTPPAPANHDGGVRDDWPDVARRHAGNETARQNAFFVFEACWRISGQCVTDR